VLALGVDAEPDQPLPALVLGGIALPGVRAMLRELAGAPGASWDRLLFSAKESVYKAWFPLTGRWLGFCDARITVNPADGNFAARLLVEGAPRAGFGGRWLARDGLILTTVTAAGGGLASGAGPPNHDILMGLTAVYVFAL
jgi:4'-phosphopantetheinyl transferase EntD